MLNNTDARTASESSADLAPHIVRSSQAKLDAAHDAALVTRFNDGDETAFVEIMSRHRNRLFSVAFDVLKDRTDAEEIAQDAFVRAHRGLGKFRGDSSLATWLHRITLNLARNRYWYFFRRRRHVTQSMNRPLGDEGDATFADLLACDMGGPAQVLVIGEFSELVGVCMKRLSAKAREILTMRVSLDHSYDRIAVELGINVGTVKSRIARARERLRVLLTEACPEFAADAEPSAWFETARPESGRVKVA